MLFRNSRLVPSAATLLFALAASLSSAQAQTQLTRVYQAKLTCGYQTGQVPLLSTSDPFPHKWENFKPGNYATSINITNSTLQSQTLYAYLSLTDPNFPLIFLGSVSLPLFGTLEVGCSELSPAFPSTLKTGQFVDAMLHLFATGNHFTVKAVYTFESRDAFERHLFVGFNDRTDEIGVKQAHGTGVSSVPAEEPFLVATQLAASGAGGLGLGASIDHENILPRTISIISSSVDERATPHPVNLLTGASGQAEGPSGN